MSENKNSDYTALGIGHYKAEVYPKKLNALVGTYKIGLMTGFLLKQKEPETLMELNIEIKAETWEGETLAIVDIYQSIIIHHPSKDILKEFIAAVFAEAIEQARQLLDNDTAKFGLRPIEHGNYNEHPQVLETIEEAYRQFQQG